MCLEGSQPANVQRAIDFSATAQCRHYHPSVMQWKGYNCFDMHSHTYYTHPPDALKFSLHGFMERAKHRTSLQAFHTAMTFSFCRSRSIRYSYFLLLALIKRWGVVQTIQSLTVVISFSPSVALQPPRGACSTEHTETDKRLRKTEEENAENVSVSFCKEIFGWVVPLHGNIEDSLNPKEKKILFLHIR